ncbi:MAG TPA: hypothetical protein VHC47_10915 [Mucilaginibacter sp.]|nr:hypothetical protein [Mucilaginibacter sp.]
MKRIAALLVITFFAVTFAYSQEGWIEHRADNRISVKFPVEPVEKIPGSFIAITPDSTVALVFTVVDFVQVANIDSVALAPIKATPEFAAQLKTGILQSMPDVDLSDFKIGTWNGFTSYTANGVDPKMKKYDIFMFIIGNKLYSLSTIIEKGGSLQDRDEFFSSVTLSN